MRVKVLRDEVLQGPHIDARRMKKLTVELRENGWSTVEIITLPDDDPDETVQELDEAVRRILKVNGKNENFVWA
jgi:hypothetical protein